MKHIRHIFFDLDRTLWDFERSSLETLGELFQEYRHFIGFNHEFDHFLPVYRQNNTALWKAFERGEINSATLRRLRWENTFKELKVGIDDWTWEMAAAYIERCPRKPYLLPGANATLDYLRSRYDLHLLTNGWTDTQTVKMECSGLEPYFGKMITSDAAQAQKPNPAIFHYALQQTDAKAEASLYIGDNFEADVLGGHAAGWDVIFYNPLRLPAEGDFREIQHLAELQELL